MSDAPRRLRDDPAASNSLRDDLSRAAADEGPPLDVAAGLAKLEAAIAAPPAAVPRASFVAAHGKLLVALGVLALLAVGAVVAWTARHDAPSRRAQTPARAVPAVLADAAPPPVADAGSSTSSVVVASAVDAGTTTDGSTTRPRPHGRLDAGVVPDAGSLRDQLHDENALVARARAALDVAPADTLRLTEEGARRFPDGFLGEEREALAIRALVRLHREDEAARRAAAFLRAHGDGPFAAVVRRETRP